VIALAAIAYLILSGTATGARYFITIDEVLANPEYVGQTVRISGAVIGDTIVYDEENLIIDFSIAHIPEEFDDLALALYEAVQNPDASRLHIHIENEVMPDLLTNEAQAILTGELGEDNIFYASELLLKCPSRYEEAAPDQVISSVEG
jgi:cytochrome c-type biogenesis protein CcmE